MAEQTKKQVPPQFREQFEVAESMVQNSPRSWTEMTSAATQFSFEMGEKMMRAAAENSNQMERTMHESFNSYRQLSLDGVKAWQGYVQTMGEMLGRNRY